MLENSSVPSFVKETLTESINDTIYRVTYGGYLPIDFIYVIRHKNKKATLILSRIYNDHEIEVSVIPHSTRYNNTHITYSEYKQNRIRMNAVQAVNQFIKKSKIFPTIPPDCTEDRLYLGHYTD